MPAAGVSLGASPEAQRDALTGLPNRLGWEDAITRVDDARAARPTTESVMVFDIDGITLANATRGQDFGDRVLRQVATIVQGVLRGNDLVARIGASEFAVLLAGADEPVCVKVAARLREAFARTAPLDGFPISVAVGFATATGTDTLTRAHRWADARMYADKTAPSRLEQLTASLA